MKEQLKKVLYALSITVLIFAITAIPTVLVSNPKTNTSSEMNIISDSIQSVSAIQNQTQKQEEIKVITPTIQPENKDNLKESEEVIKTEETIKEPEKNNEESENKKEQINIVVEPADSEFIYRENIPLSYDIQLYAYNQCKKNSIRYELFLGLIKAESTFNPKEVTGKCIGLCQLNETYHKNLAKRLCNSTDLFDPYVNITVAAELIGNYLEIYNGDEHKALISYNAGGGGAKKLFKKGITTTTYSRRVIKYSNNI